jgi:hypothetical protein
MAKGQSPIAAVEVGGLPPLPSAPWRRLSCRRVLATFQLPVPSPLAKPCGRLIGAGSFSSAPPRTTGIRNTELESSVNPQTRMFAPCHAVAPTFLSAGAGDFPVASSCVRQIEREIGRHGNTGRYRGQTCTWFGGQALQLPVFGADVSSLMPGQSSAIGLLLGERQAFHEFNDLQRNGANGETFAEMSQGVKRFAIRPKEPPSKFKSESAQIKMVAALSSGFTANRRSKNRLAHCLVPLLMMRTSSSLVAQSRTPMEERSCGFLALLSRASIQSFSDSRSFAFAADHRLRG